MNIAKEGRQYKITKDDGTTVILTWSEASLLINFLGKEGLRSQIDERVENAECDWLDISKYSGTRDEFIEEIFESLVDEIDYGNSVSDDWIDDQINDLGALYGLEKEE